MNLKRAFEIGGSAAAMLRHALCVTPVLPSLKRNENPLVVPPLLGKKEKDKNKWGKEKKEKKMSKKIRKKKKSTKKRQKKWEKKKQ